jgi:G3E family GTPase
MNRHSFQLKGDAAMSQSADTVRFLMVGGFLGAGKTTAIARLAHHYSAQGLRVGIVTNDQAYNLVDTQSLRGQGFDVGEVPGACFCCKFNELLETVTSLSAEHQPDIILSEPVGSCTDLAATVIEPLRRLHGDRFEVGKLAVLLKPEHGRKILSGAENLGFSSKAAYIFLKQIEEADVVVLNKIDRLSSEEQGELMQLIAERFPEKQVLALSALSGDGFDQLTDALELPAEARQSWMEVDYDIYAEGEAELGWLNANVVFESDANFQLDEVLMSLINWLQLQLQPPVGEIAHLKVYGQSGETSAVANVVSSDSTPQLSLASGAATKRAELIVNARVAIDPEVLEQLVTDAIGVTAEYFNLEAEISAMQRFRPGRPVPTHRVGSE